MSKEVDPDDANSGSDSELNDALPGEEKIFSARSLLFFFHENQWKKRGIGNLKI